MRRRAYTPLYCVLIAALAVTTAITLRGGIQDAPKVNRKNVEVIDPSQWPLADLNSAEPPDPAERDKRRAKSRKHNRSLLGVKGAAKNPPPAGRIILITHWQTGLPALPTEQSSAVIMGEVVDAHAYVSADRSGVYSEFTIRVDEVLKNNDRAPLTPGALITADREGGRVKIRPDQTVLFTIQGQRMPLVKRQYLFFLNEGGPESNYNILTAYEVREGRVFPLDDVRGHPIVTLTGKDVLEVLQTVRGSGANEPRGITN